jgi:hypothetical protein
VPNYPRSAGDGLSNTEAISRTLQSGPTLSRRPVNEKQGGIRSKQKAKLVKGRGFNLKYA